MSKNRYIHDYGGSGETIVLLHGFASSSRYWKKLQPLLSADGYRVIAIDLLGFGKAPKPKTFDYSYGAHLQHIHDALRELKIVDPYILIGHSMGALLAARYTIVYEKSVRSLVLLHPPLYTDRDQVRETLRATGILHRILLDSRMRGMAWNVLQGIGFIGRHTKYSREGSMAQLIERAEIFDDLQAIQTATLLFIGAKDRVEYRANLQKQTLSSHVQVVVENVGHNSPLFNAKTVHRRLRDFLISET